MPAGYGGDMGRVTKPGSVNPRSLRPWEPSGAAWEAVRAHLWARWRSTKINCYHCNCPYDQAPPDQIEHLISPQKRPDLAMAEENLRPTHSKCPPPPAGCGLSCNNIAAGNAAPRDYLGRSLPFPPAFKAQKMTEAAAKAAQGPRARRALPPSARRAGPAPARPRPPANPGRDWLQALLLPCPELAEGKRRPCRRCGQICHPLLLPCPELTEGKRCGALWRYR
jgi:hypothetical protein